MGTRTLFGAAVLASILFSQHALAFTVDEKSGTSPDGSARYVDPDEQPIPLLTPARPSEGSEFQNSGSQYQPPLDRNGQWLRLPDWFFSPPPRR